MLYKCYTGVTQVLYTVINVPYNSEPPYFMFYLFNGRVHQHNLRGRNEFRAACDLTGGYDSSARDTKREPRLGSS